MLSHQSLPRILILSMLALPALCAQHELPPGIAPHAVPWPSEVSSGDFSRAVAGEFSRDGIADVVQLRGSTAVLFVDPMGLAAAGVVPGNANDIAVLEGIGGDSLAVVDATGLRIVFYDPAQAEFATAFGEQAIESVRWIGAQRVRAADLDGNGTQDLLGVASDGETILQIFGDGQGQFSGESDIHVGSAIYDLHAIQWDSDASSEIAALTERGVLVMERTGTLRDVQLEPHAAGDCIAVLSQGFGANPSRQRLAWISSSPDGINQELVIRGMGDMEATVSIGSRGARAMTSGDLDGDGDSDLLVSVKQGQGLMRVENERSAAAPTSPAFASMLTEEREVVDLTDGPVPTWATPLCADLDGDGRLDQFTARAAASVTYALALPAQALVAPPGNGGLYLETAGHPVFVHADFVSAKTVGGMNGDCENLSLGGRLFLELRPDGWEGVTLDADTSLEIIAWKQTFPEQAYPDSAAYVRRVYSLAELDCPQCPAGGPWRAQLEFPESASIFSNCYFILVRLRRVQGLVVTNYQAYYAGFTGDFREGLQYYTGSCTYLLNQAGAWPASIPYTEHDGAPCLPREVKQYNLGGLVPQARIPPFVPGQAPVIPSIQSGPPPGISAPPQ